MIHQMKLNKEEKKEKLLQARIKAQQWSSEQKNKSKNNKGKRSTGSTPNQFNYQETEINRRKAIIRSIQELELEKERIEQAIQTLINQLHRKS